MTIDKTSALRLAHRSAMLDYMQGAYDRVILGSILAYLTSKLAQHVNHSLWAIPGRMSGHLVCSGCGQRFGDTDVLPSQGRKRYLARPSCPHCGCDRYTMS